MDFSSTKLSNPPLKLSKLVAVTIAIGSEYHRHLFSTKLHSHLSSTKLSNPLLKLSKLVAIAIITALLLVEPIS